MSCIIRYKGYRLLWLCAGMILMLGQENVSAQTAYRCKKSDGSVVYTNVWDNETCRQIETPERFITPSGSSKTRRSGKRSAKSSKNTVVTLSGSSNNYVQPKTQLTRDQKRRAILEGELALEQKNLNEAKQLLAHQKQSNLSSATTDVQQNKIVQHQRNIEALRRELARIPR